MNIGDKLLMAKGHEVVTYMGDLRFLNGVLAVEFDNGNVEWICRDECYTMDELISSIEAMSKIKNTFKNSDSDILNDKQILGMVVELEGKLENYKELFKKYYTLVRQLQEILGSAKKFNFDGIRDNRYSAKQLIDFLIKTIKIGRNEVF